MSRREKDLPKARSRLVKVLGEIIQEMHKTCPQIRVFSSVGRGKCMASYITGDKCLCQAWGIRHLLLMN